MPFCAPPTDRTEEIVPVQDGGSARGYHGVRTPLADKVPGDSPADSRPGCIFYIAACVENLLFCRRPSVHELITERGGTAPWISAQSTRSVHGLWPGGPLGGAHRTGRVRRGQGGSSAAAACSAPGVLWAWQLAGWAARPAARSPARAAGRASRAGTLKSASVSGRPEPNCASTLRPRLSSPANRCSSTAEHLADRPVPAVLPELRQRVLEQRGRQVAQRPGAVRRATAR